MDFKVWPRGAVRTMTMVWTAALLALAPQTATAQDVATIDAGTPEVAVEPADASAAGEVATSGYTPLGPEDIVGAPTPGGWNVQEQHSVIGDAAIGFHWGLIWVMLAISVFVLALLIWVVIRYNRRANPTPSKTTHNTMIEVVWTVVPALILVVIAFPSISLLAKQYELPPEDAIVMKATGYQWYWGYEFPDHGVNEFLSNMMDEDEANAAGFPGQLEVDNRVVLPVDTPILVQVTAADVIHSFAVPALWFKIDAVPGRLNERMLTITEPGIYYGQCSELCGPRHGYMPIAIEAVSREQWEAWIASKGGSMPSDEPAVVAEDAESAEDAAEAGDAEGEAEADAAEADATVAAN